MTFTAPEADNNDKTVIKGQKGPSPYNVAIFCSVGFIVAVIVIIFAILVPMSNYVDTSVSEIVGCTAVMQEYEIIEVVIMGGTGVADLRGLYAYFDGQTPIKYTPPMKYEVGSAAYYQFDQSLKGRVGNLQIYGDFTDGRIILIYDETAKMM